MASLGTPFFHGIFFPSEISLFSLGKIGIPYVVPKLALSSKKIIVHSEQ
jgi:hypothetical protein